ncbi:hypothetical protein [Vibrio marisflavi]|uniref:hypothetical protein n=1 Tax=Vibrio marisflavi TaxID=1216040 RepID=UPI001F278858|nr:hypothetical protein [Vibrio marisflavi]
MGLVLYVSIDIVSTGMYIRAGIEKVQVLKSLPSIYNWVVYYLISLSFLCAIARYHYIAALSIFLLMFDVVLVGMRVNITIALVGSILIVFYGYRLSFKSAVFSFVAGIFLVFTVIFIKPMLRIFVTTGEFFSYFDGSSRLYTYIGRMEPFPQISIFNTVVKHSIEFNRHEWFNSVITLFGFGSNAQVVKFTSVFAPFYHGIRDGALGSSSIGEMYALFGVLGIVVFCLLYPLLLVLLSTILRKYGDLARIFILPIVPIIGFYFYRNDIYFSLLQMRRILFYSFVFFTVLFLVKLVRRKYS